MFRCNLPPVLLAEWPGSFTCHWVTRGWNRHQIRVSTQSGLWRKKFSRHSCQDSNSHPLGHESGVLTYKRSQLPFKDNKMMLIIFDNIVCYLSMWCVSVQRVFPHNPVQAVNTQRHEELAHQSSRRLLCTVSFVSLLSPCFFHHFRRHFQSKLVLVYTK